MTMTASASWNGAGPAYGAAPYGVAPYGARDVSVSVSQEGPYGRSKSYSVSGKQVGHLGLGRGLGYGRVGPYAGPGKVSRSYSVSVSDKRAGLGYGRGLGYDAGYGNRGLGGYGAGRVGGYGGRGLGGYGGVRGAGYGGARGGYGNG